MRCTKWVSANITDRRAVFVRNGENLNRILVKTKIAICILAHLPKRESCKLTLEASYTCTVKPVTNCNIHSGNIFILELKAGHSLVKAFWWDMNFYDTSKSYCLWELCCIIEEWYYRWTCEMPVWKVLQDKNMFSTIQSQQILQCPTVKNTYNTHCGLSIMETHFLTY